MAGPGTWVEETGRGPLLQGPWPAASSGWTSWAGSRLRFPGPAVSEGPLESTSSVARIRQEEKLRLREARWLARSHVKDPWLWPLSPDFPLRYFSFN